MSAVVAVLATIGAISVVASVGWFLFCWRTAAAGDHDPAEPSPLATWQDSREAYRNVRVLPQASDPVTLTHYLVGDNVIDLRDEYADALAEARLPDRYQHDLGPACALCGGDHSPASAS